MTLSHVSDDPRAADRPACRLCDERPAVIRGLCRRCRQGVRRDVAAGRLTEAELIAADLLLPGAKGRPRALPPWRRKLEEFRTAVAKRGERPTV